MRIGCKPAAANLAKLVRQVLCQIVGRKDRPRQVVPVPVVLRQQVGFADLAYSNAAQQPFGKAFGRRYKKCYCVKKVVFIEVVLPHGGTQLFNGARRQRVAREKAFKHLLAPSDT
jgi:hypothetical protein